MPKPNEPSPDSEIQKVSRMIDRIDIIECRILSAACLAAIGSDDPSTTECLTTLAREISEAGVSLGATLANLAIMIERRRAQAAEKGAHHA